MTRPAATFSLGDLVSGGVAEVHAGQIRLALETAAEDLYPGWEQFALVEAIGVLRTAIADLRHLPATRAAALALAQAAPAPFHDHMAIAAMRCKLLFQLRPPIEAMFEANRLLAMRPSVAARDERIRQFIADHDLGPRLLLQPAAPLPARKPAAARNPARAPTTDPTVAPQNFVEAARALNVDKIAQRFSPGFVGYLLRARGMAPTEAPALRRELAWGFAVRDYCQGLRSGNVRRLDPSDPQAKLFAEMFDRDDTAALAQLRALTGADRGIVVLQSHAGRRGLVSRTLRSLNYPLSLVGRVSKPAAPDQGDFNFSTMGPNMALDFLKLVKLHRKGPRITRIFPDGHDGAEHHEIDLFGSRCSVAMGASTLAWFGKAVLVFARTHWTGEGWRVDLVIGPDIATFADKEAADRAYVAFCADQLRQLLLGPLRDLGGDGGFLSALARTNK